jgi:hypothetical protein
MSACLPLKSPALPQHEQTPGSSNNVKLSILATSTSKHTQRIRLSIKFANNFVIELSITYLLQGDIRRLVVVQYGAIEHILALARLKKTRMDFFT